MWNCLDQLEENEIDIEKISNVTHKFLLANAMKNANKIIDECLAEGKIFLNDEQKKKKIDFLIKIFYEHSLNMLKEKLLE